MEDNRRAAPPRTVSHDTANEQFVRDILSWVARNSEARTEGKCFGEVSVKLIYSNGEITSARLLEETILRPRTRGA